MFALKSPSRPLYALEFNPVCVYEASQTCRLYCKTDELYIMLND